MNSSVNSLIEQIMKSFHLSGPKFDIAMEMFCMVEFSIRSEIQRDQIRIFLLGQKFVVVEFEFSIRSEICRGQIQFAKIGPKKANFAKGAHLYPCQMAPTSLSHYFEWKYA